MTATSSDSQRTDSDFATWASSVGIRMPSVTLTRFSASSRGMRASQTIDKGAPLVRVPAASALQVTSTCFETVPASFDATQWKKLPWFARLALLILTTPEHHPLYPWLSTKLPISKGDEEPPYKWSSKQIDELQSPALRGSLIKQKQAYASVFAAVKKAQVDGEERKKINQRRFFEVVDCIRARAFSGPLETAPFKDRFLLFVFIFTNTVAWPLVHVLPWQNALNGGLTAMFSLAMFDVILPRIQKVITGFEPKRYALVPGIDMFNHDSARGKGSLIEFQYFTNSFEVRSSQPYNTDEEVFISYGDLTNDALLQYYSFVDVQNPADSFVFDDEVSAQLGFAKNQLLATKAGFSRAVVAAAQKALDGADREKVVRILREMCIAQLERFPTSAEKDELLLQELMGESDNADADVDVDKKRLKLAVQYRLGKKRLLQNVIDNWETS